MNPKHRLRQARLYLVTDLHPGGRELADVLQAAVSNGVDVVQLRDKAADDAELLQAAILARRICHAAGALLIINDRPDLVTVTGADGCHVGQDDMPVERARALAGGHSIVGLSTHTPEQIDAAAVAGVDYIGVGPVHATPTKPGRPAVGTALVRHAAGHATVPFFAIGGIDPTTIAAVVDAGATRVAVVRAISEAPDPGAAAAALRAALPSGTLTQTHGAAT